MRYISKLFMTALALSVVLSACGGGGGGGGGAAGGTSTGTFTKQFGTTDSGGNSYPFNGANDTKTQYLYTVAEIGAASRSRKFVCGKCLLPAQR